jgi:hypothetical protein
MDTIRGLREHVEVEFGQAIVCRDDVLINLGQNPGLGPPDLCWLQKKPVSAFKMDSAEPTGYYHWVLGRDVATSAAIAAYFASLSSSVEEITFLQVGCPTNACFFCINRGLYAMPASGLH